MKVANSWLILNVGGGPTDDKPTVTLTTPPDPNQTSAFLNIRVADIARVYREWSAKGAHFLTELKDHWLRGGPEGLFDLVSVELMDALLYLLQERRSGLRGQGPGPGAAGLTHLPLRPLRWAALCRRCRHRAVAVRETRGDRRPATPGRSTKTTSMIGASRPGQATLAALLSGLLLVVVACGGGGSQASGSYPRSTESRAILASDWLPTSTPMS